MIGVRTSSTATTPVDRRLASRTVSGSIVGAAPMRRRYWSDLDQRRVAVGCSNLCASAASAHRTDVGVRTFVPLRAPDPLRAVVWVPASTQKPPQTAAARHRGETWCRADGRAAGISGCANPRACLMRRLRHHGVRTRTCCRPKRIRHHDRLSGGRPLGRQHHARRHGPSRSPSRQPRRGLRCDRWTWTHLDRPRHGWSRCGPRRHDPNHLGCSSGRTRPDGPVHRSARSARSCHEIERRRTPWRRSRARP